MRPHLFLIGYRGTGKTTVGALLAHQIDWPFVDADVHLEAVHHQSIKEIFAAEGEIGFRDKESAAFADLVELPPSVISTGGGIVLRVENRTALRAGGFSVWLKASVPTIAARLSGDPTTLERRPNLTTGGIEEIKSLLHFREPLYRLCADLEIDTEGRSPEAIVETILTAWTPSHGFGRSSSSGSAPASAASST